MPDVRTDTGFRSLVEKIQENGGDDVTERRPPRRRLTLPGGGRERARAAAEEPSTALAPDLRVHLLQRRWL
ncbi:MAG: hypothetical protein OEL76_00470 [Siculibacillus sp.]|nr:hypothetical protein [Siculibacillus sp.]